MIKILICCLGGFSSSSMTKNLQKNIINMGYEDKMEVKFSPFSLASELLDEVDVIMACPHLGYKIPEFINKHGNSVPIYVIPPRMYGTMYVDDIYEDALDIVNEYKETKMNPFHFPNEERNIRIKRIHSYRKSIMEQ